MTRPAALPSLCLLLPLLAFSLSAQALPNLGDTTSPAPRQPGHALIGGPHEVMNPANGSVTFTFKIPLPPGRGLTPDFTISYSSAGAHSALFSSDGWSYGVPVLTYTWYQQSPDGAETCQVSTGHIVQMPDGSRQQLGLSVTGQIGVGAPPGDTCPQWYDQELQSEDNGWASVEAGAQDNLWCWCEVDVTTPSGETVVFPGGQPTPTYGVLAASITDRNGNKVTYSATSSGALTLTDTLGRVLTTNGFAQNVDSISVPGMTEDYFVQWANQPANAVINYVGAAPNACPNSSAKLQGGTAITSIATPEGTYTFSYDPFYGTVERLTYPNGGYVRYVWGLNPQSEEEQSQKWDGSQWEPCGERFDNPVITDRYVSADGTHEIEHQSFQYSTTWGTGNNGAWTGKQTIVTSTDAVSGTTNAETYVYTPGNDPFPPNAQEYVAALTPLEQTITSQSGGTSGPVLRTVTESWTGFPFLPTDQQTALNGVNVSEIKTTYNNNLQPTERDEYGYPNNIETLLRKTTLSYASFSQNIVDRPSSEVIADGSGVKLAESDYGYDVNANLTSLARWVAGSTFLISNFTNDAYGNRLTAKDPAGNTTTFSYADSWVGGGPTGTNAYLTQVTDALGHVDKYSWNFASGTLASHTDQNGNPTNYAYDAWARLDDIMFPDGGETTFAYTPSTLETMRKIDSSRWTDSMTLFDGLGRAEASSSLNAAGTYDRADTCYNGAGEVSFSSYPYFVSSSTAAPNCSGTGDGFLFDALGRETQTTHSDGTTFLTSYVGRATETQDEGNGSFRVTRIAQTDGLGNLASVCEITSVQDAAGNNPSSCNLDLAGTGFLTSYAHDALGNLLTVTQGTETRSFLYDGLSRLLSATNPESGTTAYTYDPDSNVLTRTRPAPNQTSPSTTVTTTYTHDPLDRLLSASYSDGSTPARHFTYDQASLWGQTLQNPVGRLTEGWTGSNPMPAAEIFSYDPIGRTIQDWQCTPADCGTTALKSSYGYDFTGDNTWETRETVPGGYVYGLNYTFDAALRLTGITGGLNDSQHPGTLASNLQYNPRGQLTGMQLGNGQPEIDTYDTAGRGRLLARSVGPAYNLSQMQYAPDGEVLSLVDAANGNWSFGYSPLNQLTSANCSAHCLQYQPALDLGFSYDRYGNRWAQNVTAGTAPAPSATFTAGNNRMDGYSYDAAGNLLNDGHCSYSYDAENQLVAVSTCTAASYTYNAFGQRVRTVVNGTTQDLILGLQGEAATAMGQNNSVWDRGEIYAGGRHLASYADGTTYFTHADWQGTMRVRTGVDGATAEICTSLIFGDDLSCGGTDASPLHFTGKYRDSETSLDYFGARYYSSQIGRFLSPDWSDSPQPIPFANLQNPQSLNLYSYVLNNPATATDPDGHDAGQTAGGYGPKPSLDCNELNPCGLFGESSQADEAEEEYADGVLGPTSALVAAQDAARANPAFAPSGKVTHCNQATCAVAKAMGAPMGPLTDAEGNPLSANQMAANLAASAANGGPYREVSPAVAQLLADEGKLVIGAWQNPDGPGHVVTVRPEGVVGDDPFGHHGPILNDIGQFDRIARQSGAFANGKVVRYYTPSGGGNQ